MWKWLTMSVAVVLLAGGAAQAQLFDITNPGDPVQGVPNDNDWPANEAPPLAIDNQVAGFKYLHFKGDFEPDPGTGGTGIRVTPSGPKVVVKALNFATANDTAGRDPISFRLSGSNDSIDGPYTVIAEGTIDALSQATAYPRNTWIPEPVAIVNRAAYKHYELIFTAIRGPVGGGVNSMQIGEIEFLSDGSLPGSAGKPVPADGATDVLRDVSLAWMPGEMAATHDVYFGTVFEDVNNASRGNPMDVLVSQGQTNTTYAPPAVLEYGQTYFWRIDEVNAAPDFTIFKGDVWSFTVEPFAYPITGVTATASSAQTGMAAQNAINGSGLNADDQHSTESTDMWTTTGAKPAWIQFEFAKVQKLHEMWVWNSNQLIESFLGLGAKDVTVEYSTDGTTWATLEGVPEFAKGTAAATYTANTTVSFGGVLAKYVKVTINANWGGMVPQTGLAEVRFFYVPVQAFQPKPADGAVDVSVETDLAWRPGREATSHVVYIGTDRNAVADGAVAGKTVTDSSYTPTGLLLDTEYSWKVDEVGDTGTYAGDVWTLTTEAYAVVDDFESYTDDEGNRIYEIWVDGLTDGKNGSQVGYNEAPFAEKTIVHGGSQSMPLAYDNTSLGFSEATKTFASPQNWAARGIKTLAIHFAGAAGNGGQLYLKINSTKVLYDGSAENLTRGAWQAWNLDLSKVGNVSSVRSLTIGIEGAGTTGTLYIDSIRLYPKAPEFITPADPGAANLVALYTLDGNANDTSGKGNNGTVNGTGSWVTGKINQALLFDGATTYVDCGSGASLNLTDAVTITAWIKMEFTAGDRKIAGNQDGTTGGYKLGLYTNNKVEFEVRTSTNAATGNRASAGGTVLQSGTWYHVAGVYSKGQFIRTYVYGNLDRELVTEAALGTSTGTLKLGREPMIANYFWLGAMDDVKVYNRALSQEEILWVMGQKTPVVKPF
jgi:hypothetical protein